MSTRLIHSPTSTTAAPTDVGVVVRRLRTQKGLSTRELARRTGIPESYVSKVELGQRSPPPGFCDRVARVLGLTTTERELLHALEILQSTEEGKLGSTDLQALQQAVRELERASRSCRVFQLALIPGLLQTPAYMRAIFHRIDAASNIDLAVKERLTRQVILRDSSRSFEFLVSEFALRPLWCSAGAMDEQRQHLYKLAKRPNVDIRIFRGDAPLPRTVPPLPAGFEILDDQIVIVDSLTGFTALRRQADVARYARSFADAFAVVSRSASPPG